MIYYKSHTGQENGHKFKMADIKDIYHITKKN